MKPSSSKFPAILLLIGVIVAMGWVSSRKMTPGGSSPSGCGAGATCTTTPRVSGAAAVEAKTRVQGDAPTNERKKASTGLPRLVDLGSTTCTPCKMMTPILDDLSKGYKGKLTVEFINVSENPKVAGEYNVRMIPTQVFFDKNGHEFFRHVGFYPKEDILAKFREHGTNLDRGSTHD